MKVLVTGSEGFIGSHLTEKLLDLGYEVRAFILYNSFNSRGWLRSINIKNKKNIEFFFGDIRDPDIVMQAVKDCNTVFHLASLIGIPYSYSAPSSYIETNVRGTLNVLNAIKEQKDARIIHTSTSEVYGTAQYHPIDESHPLNAQSPYAASKIAADQLVSSYTKSFETSSVIIRPFNTFGPRQSLRAVIPTIISQCINNSKSIKLGSLSPRRDFTFVSDTVNGFIAAMNSDKKNAEVYNLGTNSDISIGNLAEIIINKINPKLRIETDEIRERPDESEVMRLISNFSKAKDELNWKPYYVNEEFKVAIDQTIEWVNNNMSSVITSNYTI